MITGLHGEQSIAELPVVSSIYRFAKRARNRREGVASVRGAGPTGQHPLQPKPCETNDLVLKPKLV